MNKWQALKKVVKPRTLIFLIILLTANSLAWFIYATEVDNEMSAHVRAWKVLFEAGDSPIVDFVEIDVENLYPGMEDEIHQITAYNSSDVSAYLTYTLLEASIMNDEFVSIEGRKNLGQPENPVDLASEDLLTKLYNDYPFKITISLTKSHLDAVYDEAVYTIKVEWPYESGDDALDTLWGKQAAAFKEANPDVATILLKIKISIVQAIQ